MWSPRQVTHLPPVWDLLLPLAYMPDRREQWLLVSHPKDTDIQSIIHVESQVFTPKYNMLGPRIEPRTPACQVGVLTTTLPHRSG